MTPRCGRSRRAQFGVLVAVQEVELEQESVELRLREAEDALLLVRILVAITKNGGSSEVVRPPIVTCRSCIASSRPACTRGGVRLISSARSTLVKIAPRSSTSFAAAHLHRADQLVRRRVPA